MRANTCLLLTVVGDVGKLWVLWESWLGTKMLLDHQTSRDREGESWNNEYRESGSEGGAFRPVESGEGGLWGVYILCGGGDILL